MNRYLRYVSDFTVWLSVFHRNGEVFVTEFQRCKERIGFHESETQTSTGIVHFLSYLASKIVRLPLFERLHVYVNLFIKRHFESKFQTVFNFF